MDSLVVIVKRQTKMNNIMTDLFKANRYAFSGKKPLPFSLCLLTQLGSTLTEKGFAPLFNKNRSHSGRAM